MTLLLLALAGALAVQPASDRMQLVVAIDDRQVQRLRAPMLKVDQAGVAPVPFRDDGTLPGDVAGDGIRVASSRIFKTETLGFEVVDDGSPLGRFGLLLPSTAMAKVALRTTRGDPPLVLDLSEQGGEENPSERQTASDAILLRVQVDDRAVRRLTDPVVSVVQAGAEPARLLDDGSVEGDTAGDRIFAAKLLARRAQNVVLVVKDEGQEVGRTKVFLPSSGGARLRLRTTASADGIELVTEPVSTAPTAAPTSASASAGDDADLVLVVWTAIVLFAIGFGYVRTVVRRAWQRELRPLLDEVRALRAALEQRPPGPRES